MKMNWVCSVIVGCAAAVAGSQVMAQNTSAGAPAAGAASSQDTTFLHKAAEGGLLEIQLGQLASQKSTNPDVQAFGQKMVHDHTQLNDQMKPIAVSLGVTPPDHLDKRDQAKYNKLSSLSGTEFDQAYLKMMLMDHRMDLRQFRQEEASTTNPQLKQAVAGGETVIQQHLQIVTSLAQKNGVPVKGGSPAAAAE